MAEDVLATTADCDKALYQLLRATIRMESLTAERDAEIAAIQKRYAPGIAKAGMVIATLEVAIEDFYAQNRAELEVNGTKRVQLEHGFLGMRAPAHPPLIPLSAKWTWDKIAVKVQELWKTRFFHPARPPALDKTKLKKELTPDQLHDCGLVIDNEERFYYELNRLAAADSHGDAA